MTELFTTTLSESTTPVAYVETEARVQLTEYDLDRLQHELNRAGQQQGIATNIPTVLRRFFTGEIDLDTELGKRFTGAPLLSMIKFRPESWQGSAYGTAALASQDGVATLNVDVNREQAGMELSFTHSAMLSLRFYLTDIPEDVRRRWLDLMRREQGVAFLLGPTRWDRDYMIFVVRKYNARAYAFSANRFEAAVRLTTDVLGQLLDWLEHFWFSDPA